MTKTELIKTIAADSGLTATDAGKALDAFVSAVSRALAAGDDVAVAGLGTFSVAERAERQGRKKMIAKIKIGQKELAMAEQDYRAMLLRVTGKSSCALLSVAELERVLRELGRLGFAPAGALGRRPLHLTRNGPMMRKLAALLKVSGKSWAYADGMARRMFAKDKVSLLRSDELHKLIAALNIHIIKTQNKQ